MAVLERRCVYCGRPESDTGLLSRRGKCEECAERVMELNVDQMRARSGPFYEHYAYRRWLGAQRRLLEIVQRNALDTGDGTA